MKKWTKLFRNGASRKRNEIQGKSGQSCPEMKKMEQTKLSRKRNEIQGESGQSYPEMKKNGVQKRNEAQGISGQSCYFIYKCKTR